MNSNLRYILPIGFSIIITMMVVTSFYATTRMEENSELIFKMIKQKNLSHKEIRTMSQVILKRSTILVEMLQTEDPFILDELHLEFNAIATKYVVSKRTLEEQLIDPKIKKIFNDLTPVIHLNGALQYKVYELIRDERKEDAIHVFVNQTLPKQKQSFDIIRKMEEFQFSSAKNIIKKTEESYDSSQRTLLFFNISSVLFCILLTLYILRKQKESDEKLSYLAEIDTLTELPNRASLLRALDMQTKKDDVFSVIFFDIDYFKSINDNYGHETGDEIIKKFSEKINSYIHPNDFLARLGGDEFVLILNSINNPLYRKYFIEELSQRLDTTLTIDKNEVYVTSSIGVSVYPQDGENTKALLKNADFAMYTAKQSGRNCYSFFSNEIGERMEKENNVCHSLQTILKNGNINNELHMLYQPLIDIKNNNMKECEALIRWTNLMGERIGPDEFIPLAEKNNLIERINLFVIDEVCRQQYEWQKSGIKDIRININLSGNKLIFRKLLIQFKYNLTQMELSPSMFGIELTERTLNEISQETITELEIIRDMGMKISIDDFGTDYSSLSNLKKLPVTTLKIDKGFIDGLPTDKKDHAMVKTIINLGHSLDLDVVAEGVETAGQLNFLKENSCNTAQGYYFHRPLRGDQISKIKLVA